MALLSNMTHEIKICKKYIKNGNILWYLDQSNNRYTVDDVRYIIKNGRVSDYLSVIYGNSLSSGKNLYKATINMMETVTGILRCKDKELEACNVRNKEPICVVTEDSTSGYIFYYNILALSQKKVDGVKLSNCMKQ